MASLSFKTYYLVNLLFEKGVFINTNQYRTMKLDTTQIPAAGLKISHVMNLKHYTTFNYI